MDYGSTNSANNEYFATKKASDCAQILINKSQSFFNLLRSNAYMEKLTKSWRAYYGSYGTDLGYGHQLDFTGEQGELVSLPVNHYRNIAEHMLNMITANRPVMDARAINTDYKSQAQTILANGILDYYMREKNLENVLKEACEMSIVLGASYVKLAWNATAGEPYDYDEESKEMNYEGEIEFTTLSPFDVVFDGTKERWDHQWLMTRTFQNRFDLMAKYPEMADKIRMIPAKTESQVYRLAIWSNDDTDDVPVYEFFHKRTESLPDGRYLLFLDNDVVLMDAKLPYRVLPVFRMSPANIMGTPYGYTDMFDIFPLQESINALFSSIMTNNNAFGVQNVFVPRGSDVSISSIEGAMNIIEANAKPEAINLTNSSPEIYKFLDMIIQQAETISGINSVARGNPEASLKSGTALALVQSMALQFISGLQQSYVKLIEEVGTALIQILKDYANTPKLVALVGKNNRPLLKEFTGEQISAINRVVVDMGNALSRSIAGRVQMAEQLLQMKLLTNPQQYFQVINTGRLDATWEGSVNELMLIRSENEKLLDGEVPLVSPTDKHSMHIEEHTSVLSDPDVRTDPKLVSDTMQHIQMHMDALRNTDPALLAIVGEKALPPINGTPPNPPGQPGVPQGAVHAPPMQQELAPNPGQVVPGQQISGPGVQNVAVPNLPKPPGQFKNLPVTAQQLTPPAPR